MGLGPTRQDRLFEADCTPDRTTIIVVEGQDVGAYRLDTHQGDLWIYDIAILPEHQRVGLGTAVLRDILRTAASQGVACRLGVLTQNRDARRLYERLGFKTDGEMTTSILMSRDGGGDNHR